MPIEQSFLGEDVPKSSLILVGNNTQLGGGIYSDNNTFNTDGPSVFERNVATFYGGGIYT